METIKIGFTGTRQGMHPEQIAGIVSYLRAASIGKLLEIRIGDAKGSDEMMAYLSYGFGAFIIGYPSNKAGQRCLFPHYDVLFPAKDPLERNDDIIEASEFMLATPFEYEIQPRGGTWTVIRHSVRAGVPGRVFFRNGSSASFLDVV